LPSKKSLNGGAGCQNDAGLAIKFTPAAADRGSERVFLLQLPRRPLKATGWSLAAGRLIGGDERRHEAHTTV
jgi:hypothetical protein